MKKEIANLLKRATAFVLILVTLASFAIPVSAASSDLANIIKAVGPIQMYAISNSSRVYAYSDANLSNKLNGYYIDTYAEQVVLSDISGNGVLIRYLSSKGAYRDKWYKTSDFIPIDNVNVREFQATAAMTVYRLKSSSSVTKYGSITAGGDLCYALANCTIGGKTYVVVIYKLSSPVVVNGLKCNHKLGLVDANTYKSAVKEVGNKTTDTSSFNPVWPCKNANYISTYLRYWNGGTAISQHKTKSHYANGIDISGSSGSEILACEDGVVVEKAYDGKGFGHYVIIQHANGLRSLYGHLKDAACVNKNDSVRRGQTTGYMGSSGHSTGTHLHFELFDPNNRNNVVNPWVTYFQGRVPVVIGSNSYKAARKTNSDPLSKAWCDWLVNNCKKDSAGDFVFK